MHLDHGSARSASGRGFQPGVRAVAAGAIVPLLLLAPRPGFAQEPPHEAPAAEAPADEAPSADVAALHAAEILDEHCADVASGSDTESAQALSAVGPVLAEVSAAHDAMQLPYLLFWRGRLNLCLDREDRGRQDLEAFLELAAADPAHTAQARQARKLVRRLERSGRPQVRVQTPGAAVVGGVLIGAGGLLGVLSGQQWQVGTDQRADYVAGQRDWAETQALGEEVLATQTRSRILLGSAVGAGVGGVMAFVLSTVTPRTQAKAPPTAATLVPLPEGGVALEVWGRW